MDARNPDHRGGDGGGSGRRLRGLVLAGIVLAIGVPLTAGTWLSEHHVDRRAAAVAEDLRIAARLVGDVGQLASDEQRSTPDPSSAGPLAEALGHGESFTGAEVGDDQISAAYEVRWGFATRCVHLLLREGDVRTEVTDSASCRPLSLQ